MGNALLDFVMALVRDPQAAARYAADPAGALADAHLPGVTVTDVQNLIPVVADSLAMTTPAFGAAEATANVWTSGAAAAAFDAFDIPHPATIAQHGRPAVSAVEVGGGAGSDDVPTPPPAPEPVVADSVVSHPTVETSGVADWADDNAWQVSHEPAAAEHHPGDHPDFDLF